MKSTVPVLRKYDHYPKVHCFMAVNWHDQSEIGFYVKPTVKKMEVYFFNLNNKNNINKYLCDVM